jgi:plasmid stabilization system protein ParE
MQLTYHPEAELELREAARGYEDQVAGLGERFLREFDAAVQEIRAAPTRWRIVEDDLRRYMIRRFPYGIYYRVEGDSIRILVVKHHRRHPDYWRHPLEE